MTRRTRSILMDTTLGKIFTGAADTSTATAANLIAGTTLRSTQRNFGISSTVVALKLNVITSLPFPANAFITSVKVKVNDMYPINSASAIRCQPAGSSIIVTLKTGLTYETSTSAGNVSLPALTTSATTVTSIVVVAGYTLYWDIIQIGSTRAGTGLSITPFYYIGY
jgi:hypothetical protein